MRAYFTTTVPCTEAVFRDGFTDLYSEFGRRGVYFATRPLDINDGFKGDVTLCLDVPEGTFREYDLTDNLQAESGYRLALLPADVLNGLGKPQVYDHTFAGGSRRGLLRAAEAWEENGRGDEWKPEGRHDQRHAQEIRNAIEFFDRIGWLTPLRLQEEAGPR